ncbi:hypothetical protein FALBO_17346, partial [Fusarium albosuccineum]
TWCYRWDEQLAGMNVEGNGLHLCYGQHSGYGGYGDWIRGAREIVVSQDKLADLVVDTHIRLESGDVVGSVTLNSTYNEDNYPKTPDDKTYLDDILSTINNGALKASAASSVKKGSEFMNAAIGGSLATIVYLSL